MTTNTNKNLNVGDKIALRNNGNLITLLVIDETNGKIAFAHNENAEKIKFMIDFEKKTAFNELFGELEITENFTNDEVEKKDFLGIVHLMKHDANELVNILENTVNAIENGIIDPNDGIARDAIKTRIELISNLLDRL